ncbi:MAG: nitrogenase stabilizing/protective protein NifW [Sterolibacteriaceae bacterium]|jgi:nitrogenase-stabilizing/protective protein|uniref:Nitrogenase-stabilizing/protective protein NifW n=1 Tax=Candidatus Methylophosphatis roskildensis TaxID=2899263 RepID=A0A9D7E596_9PROT|nr:nitrogenase stabilizing/protective protein NifW [Candidatus Methylophosphatis roskildensis]MBK7236998.1 nitrogenase stabilizing/protective protein NifW [Sterolibacteriaceae bacterium]MBK7665683.1 nitrogenase stabilizing/protective protein NifW [Sterolibacteriaceae bacterium]MBK9085923.1 nitrogenase stabilizing/protective protein NifW [Sterolibacteriaceae bacterium]
MNDLTQRLTQLSAAEEFLEFFAIPFEQSVVNVSRLHILKRFYQYLRQERGLGELDEAQMFACYRGLLVRAYEDFVASTPAQEKVFKVFQDADGAKHFSADSLRATVPTPASR